jgi:hypothetical protein
VNGQQHQLRVLLSTRCTRRLACPTLCDGGGVGCATFEALMARRRSRWHEVSFAGVAGWDHTALLLISHDGVDRRELEDAPIA